MTPAERARKCAAKIATRRVITQGWWTDTELVAIIQRHIEEAERSATDREGQACSKAIMALKPSASNFGAVLEAIHAIRARGTEEKRQQPKTPILGGIFDHDHHCAAPDYGECTCREK